MLQSQIVPPFVPYANSKFAIAHFIKHLSSLLVGTSVKTYAVCTGVCDTQLSRSSLGSWSRHAAMFTRYGFFTAEEVIIMLLSLRIVVSASNFDPF